MAKGQPKKKKERKDVFTVNLHFDVVCRCVSDGKVQLDPFLTKLCSARIMFRGTAEHLQTEEPLADPDDHQIHAVNKYQEYPIAWAVVRVENADNWGWFLHLLHDDLSLNDGNGITIISDSHKGLIDAFVMTEQQFMQIMDQIKQLDEGAYDYLIKRNPNSWSRAFFEMDKRCAAFENGISESFNRAILEPRHKPIITMLEEIRMWELSGVPYVHDVTAYLHCGIEIDLGVSHWYSQDCWFNAYQISFKLVFGLNMWKMTNDVPPLPPLVRRMPGRPQKSRIKSPGETSGSHTSKVIVHLGSGVEVKVEMKMKPLLVEWVVLMKLVVEGDEVLEEEVGRRGGGRGNRAVGSTRRGMARSSSMGLLTSKELDEEGFRECMEEQAREQAKNDA
ncbi:hypothetical protein Tco_0755315 [Tanacetum coccineum]